MVRQTEYEWIYVFGAVNPANGKSSALLAPTVNTDYMNHHLRFISEQAGRDVHVVLVLDRAGWHIAKALEVPANITLLHLPPYSPELNPVERLWAYIKSHYLSNRIIHHKPFADSVINGEQEHTYYHQSDAFDMGCLFHTTGYRANIFT